MKELIKVFNFHESEVRTISTPNNEVYFVASDVCKILDIENISQALSRLDEDEKTYIILNDVNVGTPKLTIITESGFYSLVLSSRKKEAKAFKKWVTSEVLPAIRKTGNYGLKSAATEVLPHVKRGLEIGKEIEKLEAAKVELKKELLVLHKLPHGCKFCGKMSKNYHANTQHELYCSQNPEALLNPNAQAKLTAQMTGKKGGVLC